MKIFANCRLLWVVAIGLLFNSTQFVRAAQTQTFRLDPGWNLISFQVIPTNPAPATVFGSLGDKFERAFAYENGNKVWSAYGRIPTSANESIVNPMGPIKVGTAYWVYVNQLVAAW